MDHSVRLTSKCLIHPYASADYETCMRVVSKWETGWAHDRSKNQDVTIAKPGQNIFKLQLQGDGQR